MFLTHICSIAILTGVALYILYYYSCSGQSSPTPSTPSDLEKADVKIDIGAFFHEPSYNHSLIFPVAASTYVPFTPRRSPPSYTHLSPEERQERTQVKSRLTAYRFPPQGPPPARPLPRVPLVPLQTPSAASRSLVQLYEEPAYPDSPTLPIGLFATDGTLSFEPAAHFTASTGNLGLRNKGSTSAL